MRKQHSKQQPPATNSKHHFPEEWRSEREAVQSARPHRAAPPAAPPPAWNSTSETSSTTSTARTQHQPDLSGKQHSNTMTSLSATSYQATRRERKENNLEKHFDMFAPAYEGNDTFSILVPKDLSVATAHYTPPGTPYNHMYDKKPKLDSLDDFPLPGEKSAKGPAFVPHGRGHHGPTAVNTKAAQNHNNNNLQNTSRNGNYSDAFTGNIYFCFQFQKGCY